LPGAHEAPVSTALSAFRGRQRRGSVADMWLRALILSSLVLRLAAAGPTTPEEFSAAYDAIRQAGPGNDAARLRKLFDLHWQWTLDESPETGTYTGTPGYNHRWSDLSREAIARRRALIPRPRAVLDSIDRSQLRGDDALWYDLFAHELAMEAAGARFPTEWLALTQMNGVQQEIAQMLALMPGNRVADFDDMIARLDTAPVRIRSVIALLREGVARGVTPPKITLRDVPQQVLNQIPDVPTNSPLYRRFAELPSSLPSAAQTRLRGSALAAITNGIYPAYRELHRFLVEDYIPRARETIACRDLPDGEAWYAWQVRVTTTTTRTPAEIHAMGLAEVKRIRAAMEALVPESGFKGSFAEFREFLRTDKQFFFERSTELLAGYRDISKRIDGELPRLFGRLPRLPYGVMPVPSYSEKSQTTAYYRPGANSFGTPGYFFANTYALHTRPKWEMEALTLHEAVPGHHLQIALAQELEGVPDFQKHAFTTAFVEGWGLYAESLGGALGLYRDPYSRYGQLTYEMWRAIRLVVDTGMHHLGWSRQQAIDFFLENASKTLNDITVEVDRYIVWPGQALAYKTGELKLQELRRRAETRLGERFDVRAFHDAVLEKGALPLDVLEQRIEAWIETSARTEGR
jgi:uncharacterized protein (DUF885 family)